MTLISGYSQTEEQILKLVGTKLSSIEIKNIPELEVTGTVYIGKLLCYFFSKHLCKLLFSAVVSMLEDVQTLKDFKV